MFDALLLCFMLSYATGRVYLFCSVHRGIFNLYTEPLPDVASTRTCYQQSNLPHPRACAVSN